MPTPERSLHPDSRHLSPLTRSSSTVEYGTVPVQKHRGEPGHTGQTGTLPPVSFYRYCPVCVPCVSLCPGSPRCLFTGYTVAVGRGFQATGRGSATGRGRSAGELDRSAVPLCGVFGPHCGILKRSHTAGGNDRSAVKIDRSAQEQCGRFRPHRCRAVRLAQ